MSEQMEMILNTKKINYDRLNKFIPNFIPYHTEKYDTVNIIIDLYDVLKKLYSPLVLESIKGNNKRKNLRLITSEIINMVGHYRHYFASRRAKYTNFYIIFSDCKSLYHTNLFPDYRKNFYDKRLSDYDPDCNQMNKLLNANINLIKIIIERIPNCHFINSEKIEYSLIPFILMYNDKFIPSNEPTIIISNDIMFYQDLLTYDETYQLITAGDKSRIITIDTVYYDIIRKLKKVPEFKFSVNLLPVLMTFVGNKDYNIKNINSMSWGRAINFLNKMIEKGEILDILYVSEKEFKKIVNKSTLIKDELKEDIILNYKLINHFTQNLIAFNNKDILFIEKQICKPTIKATAKEIKELNSRFFQENPIIFEFCYEGEEY